MYDIEDTLQLYEAKEKAYNEGWGTGFLFGIPIGTVGTIIIIMLTADTWLPLVK